MSGSTATSPTSAADTKILRDLELVKEKMDLCDTMLNPGFGETKISVNNSEAMLAVIGFLEACGPRMVELVEAAATGVLSETVFAEALSVNDRLQKQLSDIETAASTEASASATAASASAAAGSVQEQFEDLLLDDEPSQPAVGSKSTGENEEEDSKQPAVDDFDDFFAERTAGM